MSDYIPQKSDKFTFGLWTVGNPGAEPFGGPVRTLAPPPERVRKFGALGTYGVNLLDNDLVPFGASAAERDAIVKEFQQAILQETLPVDASLESLLGAKFTAATAQALKGMVFDAEAMATCLLPYEKLDQLVFDLLLGVR